MGDKGTGDGYLPGCSDVQGMDELSSFVEMTLRRAQESMEPGENGQQRRNHDTVDPLAAAAALKNLLQKYPLDHHSNTMSASQLHHHHHHQQQHQQQQQQQQQKMFESEGMQPPVKDGQVWQGEMPGPSSQARRKFSTQVPISSETYAWDRAGRERYQQNSGLDSQQARVLSLMQLLLESMTTYQNAMAGMHQIVCELGHVMPRLAPSMDLLVPGLRGCTNVSPLQLGSISKEPTNLWWMGKSLDMQELALLLKMASHIHKHRHYDYQRAFWDGHNGGMSEQGTKRPRQPRRSNKHKDRTCAHCQTGTTPFWRKDKETDQYLCNACGLYYAKNREPRPLHRNNKGGGSLPENK